MKKLKNILMSLPVATLAFSGAMAAVVGLSAITIEPVAARILTAELKKVPRGLKAKINPMTYHIGKRAFFTFTSLGSGHTYRAVGTTTSHGESTTGW